MHQEFNNVDNLIFSLVASADATVRQRFLRFLKRYPSKKWILASDYSTSKPEFPQNAFVFALIPGEWVDPGLIKSVLPSDLKDTQQIDSKALKFLQNGPFFICGFLLEKNIRFFRTGPEATKALTGSLRMMQNWPNANNPVNSELIRKTQLVLSNNKKKSFLDKVNNVALLSILGSFVGLLIAKETEVEKIAWASDRDDMIGVWDEVAYSLFFANLHSALQKNHVLREPETFLFVDEPHVKELWYETFIRIPDYFASPLAALPKYSGGQPYSAKYGQIYRKVLALSRNTMVMRLSFDPFRIGYVKF